MEPPDGEDIVNLTITVERSDDKGKIEGEQLTINLPAKVLSTIITIESDAPITIARKDDRNKLVLTI